MGSRTASGLSLYVADPVDLPMDALQDALNRGVRLTASPLPSKLMYARQEDRGPWRVLGYAALTPAGPTIVHFRGCSTPDLQLLAHEVLRMESMKWNYPLLDVALDGRVKRLLVGRQTDLDPWTWTEFEKSQNHEPSEG